MSAAATRATLLALTGLSLAVVTGGLSSTSSAEDVTRLPSITGCFAVHPMSLDLSARPGSIVPFEVEVQAKDRPIVLEATAVGFAQNEEGTLHPAEQVGDGAAIEIDGRTRRLELRAGQRAKVRGRVFLERSAPPLQLFGVKIAEAAGDGARPAAAPGASPARGAVQLRLSYIVRLEVRAEGAAARAGTLTLEKAELADRQGRALLRAVVHNPTDAPVEVEARCQLRRDGDRVGPSFVLVLPANATHAGAARSTTRVLPGARVRLEELVPGSIPAGRYTLATTFVAGGAHTTSTTEVEVGADAFPAQALAFGQEVGGLLVSPPQVALSLERGAPRMVPLVLENLGDAPLTVQVDAEGAAADRVVLRPALIELPGRTTRRVALTVRGSQQPLTAPSYGAVRVRAGAQGAAPQERRLPLALLVASSATPALELRGAPALAAAERTLTVTVGNRGGQHAALAATLTVTDPAGQSLAVVSAGHGAWLLPGQESRLVFALPALPPGQYRLTARVGLADAPGGAAAQATPPVVRPLEAALDWSP